MNKCNISWKQFNFSKRDSSIMMKGVTEIIKNEAKEQKGGFLGM